MIGKSRHSRDQRLTAYLFIYFIYLFTRLIDGFFRTLQSPNFDYTGYFRAQHRVNSLTVMTIDTVEAGKFLGVWGPRKLC